MIYRSHPTLDALPSTRLWNFSSKKERIHLVGWPHGRHINQSGFGSAAENFQFAAILCFQQY